jgi:F-type H+/Na+-transporting ATPase subunit beta
MAAERLDTPGNNKTLYGHVLRVMGTIIDVQFPQENAPEILHELHIHIPDASGGPETVVSVEVEQQLGDGVVRCIALQTIEGISRGLKVYDTGGPIRVPVGPQVLGRICNVLGNPIDGKGPLETAQK